MKLTLHNIKVVNGNRVEYDYSYDKELKKYFSKEKFYVEYSIDISTVPKSVLIIPFLANVLPVSWFAGFDVEVEEVDEVYFESLKEIKKTFVHYYPYIENGISNFKPLQRIKNKNDTSHKKNAMLFSGGVDAYTTYLRHYSEIPDLITVKGADIDTVDHEQWNTVVDYNKTTSAIGQNAKFYIESNLRRFISFEVEQLVVGLGWWGKVQHGLALTSLTAPLAFVKNYETVYIGSTRSSKMPFSPWGSMPEIDDLVKFSSTRINHDGYELTRLDKIETILDLSLKYNIKPLLRVCYHDVKTQLNCNVCEKCSRTIFAIMIKNQNPNLFGFEIDKKVYGHVKKHLENGFSTAGTMFYWNEILGDYKKDNFYFWEDANAEDKELEDIILINQKAQFLAINKKSQSKLYMVKQKLINKYPKSFKLYLKIRRKLS